MATILLFDVDGTLTAPRKKVSDHMLQFLQQLREHFPLGIVGGSDLEKIKEQLGENILQNFDYVFSENGLLAFKNAKLIDKQSLRSYLGESRLKEIINFALLYIANLDIPIKRGTFVEFRNGMLNISPIGRNCNQEERDEFEKYDKTVKIREKFVKEMSSKFSDLQFSIGGQISFDVFPKGWDKTFCLQYLSEYDTIHFFGDKTYEGGNDYEIFVSPNTIGHTVQSPDETIELCTKLFLDEFSK